MGTPEIVSSVPSPGRTFWLGTPLMRQLVTQEVFRQYTDHLTPAWTSRTWEDVLGFARDAHGDTGQPLDLEVSLENIRDG